MIAFDGSPIRRFRRLDPRDDQQGSQHPEPSRAEAKEGNRELNFPRLDFESSRAITDDSGLVFKPRDVELGSHRTDYLSIAVFA